MKVRAKGNKTFKKQDNKSKKTNKKDKMNRATNNPKITTKMRTREKMRVVMMERLMKNDISFYKFIKVNLLIN